MSFYKIGIKNPLVQMLEDNQIFQPTPIQKLSIPIILKGEDLLAEAQTGTGKTLAFLLPLVQNISPSCPDLKAIILAPTRELAQQITEVARPLCEEKHLGCLAIYGGQDIAAQCTHLKDKIHLIIATPGRLLDHLNRKTFSPKTLEYLVIDEADQLFHIGFKKELTSILSFLPPKYQCLCFSATLNKNVHTFAEETLHDYKVVVAPKKTVVIDDIRQRVIMTSGRKKYDDLNNLLKKALPKKAIIFCRSRAGCDDLYQRMSEDFPQVLVLHGGLSQGKRNATIAAFKKGSRPFLIATDVASRGLDIDKLSHVINYNLPDDPESYVHRIGRTGRAGKGGTAYTLLTQKDFLRLEKIEAFIGMPLEKVTFQRPTSPSNQEKSSLKTSKKKPAKKASRDFQKKHPKKGRPSKKKTFKKAASKKRSKK